MSYKLFKNYFIKNYSQLIDSKKKHFYYLIHIREHIYFFNIIIISQERVKIRESNKKIIKIWQPVEFALLARKSSNVWTSHAHRLLTQYGDCTSHLIKKETQTTGIKPWPFKMSDGRVTNLAKLRHIGK